MRLWRYAHVELCLLMLGPLLWWRVRHSNHAGSHHCGAVGLVHALPSSPSSQRNRFMVSVPAKVAAVMVPVVICEAVMELVVMIGRCKGLVMRFLPVGDRAKT